MTLNAMARDAVAERLRARTAIDSSIVTDADFQSALLDEKRVGLPHDPAAKAGVVTKADAKATEGISVVERLTRYFPVEVMALYLPGVATIQSRALPSDTAAWLVWFYLGFALLLTPLVVLVLYRANWRRAGNAAAPGVPVRKMLLGLVSFATWGACVPGVFPGQQWFLGWIALVVGTLLPEIDAAFSKDGE